MNENQRKMQKSTRKLKFTRKLKQISTKEINRK